MRYKSVIVTRRGGPEVLQVIENDLRPPSAGEARIQILATPVCQDDVAVRIGSAAAWRRIGTLRRTTEFFTLFTSYGQVHSVQLATEWKGN